MNHEQKHKTRKRLDEMSSLLTEAFEELNREDPSAEALYYKLDSVFHYASAVKYDMKKASDIL